VKINIISVGKIKEKYLKDAIAEYAKRLSRFCNLNMEEVADEKAPETLSPAQEEQVKRQEAERILKRLRGNSLMIVLDIKGEKITSEGFAAKLRGFLLSGVSDITFVIGGSLGLDKSVTDKASFLLSLSDMTFPHQLARLILLEQIYRAFKINSGEPYHK
jgi:23S rRNA (pseudouridine1915-N3)-methyltransferase